MNIKNGGRKEALGKNVKKPTPLYLKKLAEAIKMVEIIERKTDTKKTSSPYL
jgi:hypothetical protein